MLPHLALLPETMRASLRLYSPKSTTAPCEHGTTTKGNESAVCRTLVHLRIPLHDITDARRYCDAKGNSRYFTRLTSLSKMMTVSADYRCTTQHTVITNKSALRWGGGIDSDGGVAVPGD